MLAVDTNVLIRVLVDDPGSKAQSAAARKAVAAAGTVFVPQVVQVECVWVLQSVFGLGRKELARQLTLLAANPAYRLQNADSFVRALELFSETGGDFADCMILVEAGNAGCELLTFDRKLVRRDGVRLVARD